MSINNINDFFLVDFGGIFNTVSVEGTLEEAQRMADKDICYTTKDIVILTSDKREVCRRRWHLQKPVPTNDKIIPVCDGYYSDWEYVAEETA